MLDSSVRQLQRADDLLQGRITTMVATEYNLKRTTQYADVVVGAVLLPGRRAPIVVTREMVANMRRRAVLIDFSIDQGGCVETSRPTTLRNPTFIEEGVIHYCVPNLTASVARTTSHAITNAAVPYMLAMANFAEEMHEHAALARGINLYEGRVAHHDLAAALGREADPSLPAALRLGGA
jgi:alanine dehydrogenase